ncbi:MAG: hypothetical protein WCC60_16930, partial [Ilumatobacteraceae bacterium]
EAWSRLLALVQVFAVAITAGTLWWAHAAGGANHTLVIALATAALLGLLVHPILRIASHRARSLSVRSNLVYRVVLIAVVLMTIYALMPGWSALWCSPFAVAGGIDASLTCSELGWRARPRIWYVHFLRSGFHLGIVGAVVATFAVGGASRLSVVVPLFVVLHVWMAVAVATLWIISRLYGIEQDERRQALAEVVESERRQRAHWLHDDVCAQVRLVSLKLQTNAATTDEVVGMLDDFDHQLRLRQLDELFGAGSVRIAELLQPYIRYAQNQGVTIAGVPGFEEAAMQLSEQSARLTARAANVLTSNALNAGATVVSYGVSTDGGFLRLVVADNGPGFSLHTVPHGRGLWALGNDLQPGRLTVEPNDGGGSVVTAAIPYIEKGGHGEHPSGR